MVGGFDRRQYSAELPDFEKLRLNGGGAEDVPGSPRATAWPRSYRCSMTLSSTSTAHLPASAQGPGQSRRAGRECQPSAGATVKDQGGAGVKDDLNSVKH